MIDENPYAPPKSVLEDFGQPEMIVKPTKMQRLVRVVLFPVVLALIFTILFLVSSLFFKLIFRIHGVLYVFPVRDIPIYYVVILVITGIPSIFVSFVMEFFIKTIKNRKIYSLFSSFLIVFSFILLYPEHENKVLFYPVLLVIATLSSYLTTIILNKHISYYNKKNCSGSLKNTETP